MDSFQANLCSFLGWIQLWTEIRMVNMGRNLWPTEAKHLFFYQRQLNSRCCQHHIIPEVPISLRVALRKVMLLNSWWLNGFCTGKSTPRCAVHAGVWCNLLCYQIRQRGKRDHKEISYFMRASWSHRCCMSCVCAHSSWNPLSTFAATGCCLKLSLR